MLTHTFLPQGLLDYFLFDKRTKVAFKELVRWLQPQVDVLTCQIHPIKALLVESWASKAASDTNELLRLISSAKNRNRGSIARDALIRLRTELQAQGKSSRPLQLYFRWCLQNQFDPSRAEHSNLVERNHLAVSAMSWLHLHRDFNPTRNPGKFDAESAASLVAKAMKILGVRHLGEANVRLLWQNARKNEEPRLGTLTIAQEQNQP